MESHLEAMLDGIWEALKKNISLDLSVKPQNIWADKGSISVDSQAGIGTTFTVILPRQAKIDFD